MPALTPEAITTIRDDHPHHERFYLSVFKPTVVYTGNVTGSPARGATVITVSDVSGNIANVLGSYTLIVFDPATGEVISKRRIRSRSGHDLTIDENNVPWTNSLDIKVINFYELWSIFPYIDPVTLIFYKARNVVYTDQNSLIPPVAIIHADRVNFNDGIADAYYAIDGSDSYAVAAGATIVSYAWTCTSGTITAPASASTTLTLNTPGQYWLTLTVTDSNGKSQVQHIIIFLHDLVNNVNPPYVDFAINSGINTSLNDGGANYTVEVFGVADTDEIPDDTYVILSSVQYYKDAIKSYGNHGNVICAGYIRADSIIRHFDTGSVTFTIETINSLMKRRKMVSVSIEESDEAANWYRFPTDTLTVARAIHHYLKWHSTIFDICNVFLPTEHTVTIPACDDFEAGTLYDMVANFARQYSIFAYTCCTLGGDLHIARDINLLSDADRAIVPVHFSIYGADRKFDPDLNIVHRTDFVAAIVVSGVTKDADGKPVPTISMCPGDIPDTYGNSDVSFERQVLVDQTDANYISGRLFAVANTDIVEIRLSLAGNYPVDIMPQEWFTIFDNTNKRVSIDGMNFLAVSINIAIDITSGTRSPELVLIPEAIAVLGDGITIEPVVPDDPADPPPPDLPPIGFPNFPPLPGTQPFVPPKPVPICNGDVPNGPTNVPAYVVIVSTDPPSTLTHCVFYPFKTRDNAALYETSMIITGEFLQDVGAGFVNNPNNDWYTVTLKDYAGNVVSVGTVTGTGPSRSVTFDLPAPANVQTICFTLLATSDVPADSLFRVDWLEDVGLDLTSPYGIDHCIAAEIEGGRFAVTFGLTPGSPDYHPAYEPFGGSACIGVDYVHVHHFHAEVIAEREASYFVYEHNSLGEIRHQMGDTGGGGGLQIIDQDFRFHLVVSENGYPYADKVGFMYYPKINYAGECYHLQQAYTDFYVAGSGCALTTSAKLKITGITLYNVCR